MVIQRILRERWSQLVLMIFLVMIIKYADKTVFKTIATVAVVYLVVNLIAVMVKYKYIGEINSFASDTLCMVGTAFYIGELIYIKINTGIDYWMLYVGCSLFAIFTLYRIIEYFKSLKKGRKNV